MLGSAADELDLAHVENSAALAGSLRALQFEEHDAPPSDGHHVGQTDGVAGALGTTLAHLCHHDIHGLRQNLDFLH